MTMPVTNLNNSFYPVGAYTLDGSNRFEPGKFVVNPPSQFYKYSVYDELKLGEDHFKQILGELASKKPSKELKQSRKKRAISKILGWTLIFGGVLAAYKFCKPFKNLVKGLHNSVKNLFTRKT